MRIRSLRTTLARGGVLAAAVALGCGVIAPLAASALDQASGVTLGLNNASSIGWAHSCSSGNGYWSFPTDNKSDDSGVETNIGNDTSVMNVGFNFPDAIDSGSVTLTAPKGPAPAAVTAAHAAWGTTFQQTADYQDNAAAASYGCTLPTDGHGNITSNFYIYNYGIEWQQGSTTWTEVVPQSWVSFPGNGNQVTFSFNLGSDGPASSMTIWIADVTNPVEGTYNGVDYSLQVNASGYSTVPAPAQNSLSFVATTPDPYTSQLTETIPNGASTLTATDNPGAGATITATIYDSFYNPVQGEAIYIGVYSEPDGGAQTEPVSQGGGNGEPVTGANGQASYYAWGTSATLDGPDLFFGEDTSQQGWYIDTSPGVTRTVALTISAATPNPASAGGAHTSLVQVMPSTSSSPNPSHPQSTTITVDQSATVKVTLVDQFGNAELDNAITLEPILSQSQSTNNFKAVVVAGNSPSGTYDPTSSADFACAQGPASEVPGASCTNHDGQTSFTITDTATQTVSFEITDLTDGYTLPFTDLAPADQGNIPVVTFTAGPTSLTGSLVTVDGGASANVLADGTDPATIHVALRDDHGNPEPSKQVYLYSSGVPVSVATSPSVTDANGNTSFTVTGTTLGSAQFEAYDATDGLWLSLSTQQPVVNFVTGHVSAANSSVSVNPPVVVGDGQGVATVTVTVVDEGSHPLDGQTVSLDASSYPDLAIVPNAAVTNSAGQATFAVRSTSVEDVSLPVLVGATSPTTLDDQAAITFTAAPKYVTVTAAPTGVDEHDGAPEADGGTNEDVTVTLSDSTHAALNGLVVELVAGNATSGPLATTSAGEADFLVGLPTTATGADLTVTYTALDVSDNYRTIGSVTVVYVPIPDESHESSVTTNHKAVYTYDASQPAGTQTAVITVALRDASGDPITGNTVSLMASSPDAVATAFSVQNGVTPGTSDASGNVYFDVTDCVPDPVAPACAPDSVDFSAKDTTTSVTVASMAHVDFVLRPNEASTSTISVAPTTVEADGHSAATVTVTLRNNGTLLSGNTVSLSEGLGHAAITTPDPVSNAQGVVTFTVRDLTAESLALQATDLTTATLLTHDAVVTFTAPPGGSLRPSVSALSPASGPGSGGTIVTVTGTNFTAATSVLFGTQPATFSTSDDGTELVAESPVPIAEGSVNVTVSGPGGTSASSSADIFTYTSSPTLAVHYVTPSWGPVSGDTQVTIVGTGLVNVRSVHFGALTASFVVSDGGATLTATSPAATTPGAVDVTVTSTSGTSSTTSLDRFAFVGPPPKPALVRPSITSLSTHAAPLAGGGLVTIRGHHFAELIKVLFGSRRAVVVSANATGTSLLVRVPAGARTGAVTVTVVTAAGRSPSVAGDRFTYRTTRHSAARPVAGRANPNGRGTR